MAEVVAIGVEASDKMLIGIMHYHISTNTDHSRNNHSKFYPIVANLIRRTRIIENLARTLELLLLVASIGLFLLFVPTHAMFPPLNLTVEKKMLGALAPLLIALPVPAQPITL